MNEEKVKQILMDWNQGNTSINNSVKQICDLFTELENDRDDWKATAEVARNPKLSRILTKPDDNLLLSWEEEYELNLNPIDEDSWKKAGDVKWRQFVNRKILQAQLAKDQLHEQARVERIIKTIEDNWVINLNRYNWYQNLKQQEHCETD